MLLRNESCTVSCRVYGSIDPVSPLFAQRRLAASALDTITGVAKGRIIGRTTGMTRATVLATARVIFIATISAPLSAVTIGHAASADESRKGQGQGHGNRH